MRRAATIPLRLYSNPVCPFVQRTRIAAIEKGAELEEIHVPLGGATPEWYTKINPRGTVPTLDANGTLVFESMIIVQYLDESLAPKNSLNVGTPETRHRTGLFVEAVGEAIGPLYGLLTSKAEDAAAGAQSANSALNAVEALLVATHPTGPFLHGAVFTYGDIALVPFLDRFVATLKAYKGFDVFANRPRLQGLYEAALLRPSVANTRLPSHKYVEAYRGYGKTEPTVPELTLYAARVCPWAQRARLAVAATKAPVKIEYLDLEALPDWFKKLNPKESVPALVIRNGDAAPKVLAESLLIASYLDETYAADGQRLLPADALLAAATRFVIDESGNAISSVHGLRGGSADAKSEFAAAWGRVEKLFEKQSSGPFFLGQTLSYADLAVGPLVLRVQAIAADFGGVPDFATSFPRLAALTKALRSSEALASHIEAPEFYVEGLKRVLSN